MVSHLLGKLFTRELCLNPNISIKVSTLLLQKKKVTRVMQEPKNASEVLHLRNNSTKTVFLPLLLSDRNEKKNNKQKMNLM